VASRKEQKEQLRREREQREQAARAAERRRRLIGYGVGGALALAAVIAIVVVLVAGGGEGGGKSENVFPGGGKAPAPAITDLSAAAKAASCTMKTVKGTSRDHTQSLSDRVHYSTNPPTSGKHYFDPPADGMYGTAPQDEQVVHAEEHGRVIIWVKPSLPASARANIRAVFNEDSSGVLLVPRADMPFAVATTAWGATPQPLGTGYLMGCPRYSSKVFDAIRTFRDAHLGKGPEPVPF
jgi:Protein of unknown function (DUF3105)